MGAVELNGADRGGDVLQLDVVRSGADVEGDVAAGDDEAIAGADHPEDTSHQTQQNRVATVAIGDEEVADGSQDEASAGAARQAIDRGVRARAALNLDQVAQYAGGPVNLEAVVRIVAGDNDCPGEDVLNCRDHARRTHSGLKGLNAERSSTFLQHGYDAS